MSSNNDSFIKTISVAVILCFVCSVIVSSAAVLLKERQQANASLDKKKNILVAAALYHEGMNIEKAFKNIEHQLVDLATGRFILSDEPEKFNQRASAKLKKSSIKIENDLARLGRRSKIASVYLVKTSHSTNAKIKTIILPIHGKGLFSTLYGFIALKADKRTVVGLKFYEQGETPGLGGEVENPQWLKKWVGKKALNDQGLPSLKLVKLAPKNEFEVDALSGASMTTRGVQNMLDYWLSQSAFGPFLAHLNTESGVDDAQ
jgi:Na+-transporting NADH:ubiquinone oxidoreductase subunit C